MVSEGEMTNARRGSRFFYPLHCNCSTAALFSGAYLSESDGEWTGPDFSLARVTASVDWSHPSCGSPRPVCTNSESTSKSEANNAAADWISEKSSSVGVGPVRLRCCLLRLPRSSGRVESVSHGTKVSKNFRGSFLGSKKGLFLKNCKMSSLLCESKQKNHWQHYRKHTSMTFFVRSMTILHSLLYKILESVFPGRCSMNLAGRRSVSSRSRNPFMKALIWKGTKRSSKRKMRCQSKYLTFTWRKLSFD